MRANFSNNLFILSLITLETYGEMQGLQSFQYFPLSPQFITPNIYFFSKYFPQ